MSLLSNTESRLILINTQAFPNMPCKERTLLNDASIHADTRRRLPATRHLPMLRMIPRREKLIAGISGDLTVSLYCLQRFCVAKWELFVK